MAMVGQPRSKAVCPKRKPSNMEPISASTPWSIESRIVL